jgi:hypothetical protein
MWTMDVRMIQTMSNAASSTTATAVLLVALGHQEKETGAPMEPNLYPVRINLVDFRGPS